jgi:predicted permease
LSAELPQAFVRLATGVPLADAMRIATASARGADGQIGGDMQATPLPLAGGALDPSYWRLVPALFGGVALVFIVLCANVCSLLLATMTARRRELQVCAALGASRRRLLTQAAAEHALVGLAGAAAGVGVAWMLVSLARTFLPDAFLLRTLHPVELDLRAFAVAAAAGLAATFAAGLLPAWLGTRHDASLTAADASRTATETAAARRVTRALLASEIALAFGLLMGASLLLRSFATMAVADRGLRTDGVLTSWVALPRNAFPDRPSRQAATDALENAVRGLTGVKDVALSLGVPPDGGNLYRYDNWLGDGPNDRPQTLHVASYDVGPEFFDLYGIPLLQGRTFRPDDGDESAIVGERLAERLWHGQSPVGHRFQFGVQHLEVVGLAREINFPSLDSDRDLPEFYQPFKAGGSQAFVSLRCVSQCPGEAAVRRAIATAIPRANVVRVAQVDAAYREELARPRATAALATVFGVIAALAVAGGLFSVLTFAVAARQREFGIRAAIGATPRALREVVYADAVRVGGAGLLVGVGAAIAVAHAIRALVYGVTVYDPRSWATVIAVLIATMAIACWRPARTAANADPVTLLRTD